jgi:hypothetical protein
MVVKFVTSEPGREQGEPGFPRPPPALHSASGGPCPHGGGRPVAQRVATSHYSFQRVATSRYSFQRVATSRYSCRTERGAATRGVGGVLCPGNLLHPPPPFPSGFVWQGERLISLFKTENPS